MRRLSKLMQAALLILALVAPGTLCRAIDNPEAPDLVSPFTARCAHFEKEIREELKGNHEIVLAYSRYEQFLEQELNQNLAGLLKHLSGKQRKSLLGSQKLWLKYREAEFEFISKTWTVEEFGTSSAISRGAYRTSIIKNRVLELMDYLRNYRD